MHDETRTSTGGGELGSFELKLLATIHRLRDRAWGSNLQERLSDLLGRDVAIGQLYLSLSKLERKGYIASSVMNPEPVRGGRSKKVFRLEAPGARALVDLAAALPPGVLLHWENGHVETAQ